MVRRAMFKDLRSVFKQLDGDEQKQVLNHARSLAGEKTEKSLTKEGSPGVYDTADAKRAEEQTPNGPSYDDLVPDPLDR